MIDENTAHAGGIANKVAEVTLAFWIIKICATTFGETAGDALSMTLKLGYAASTGVFAVIFAVALAAQVAARRYHPSLYWAVIVATTTVGTTLADYLTRTAELGYPKTSLLLFACVLVVLGLWRAVTGSVSVRRITTRRAEVFYWVTILISNTLGTALGDALADAPGFGYEKGALVFAGMLAVIVGLAFFTRVSRTLLFWAAFILTRPLGATLGDMLTKPREDGGLDLSRISSSVVIGAVMIVLVALFSRKPEQPGTLERI